jgi:TPR repeat protein
MRAAKHRRIWTLALALGFAALSFSASAAENFDLAVRYEHGEGVKQDYAEALKLYCEAAEQNDARAFTNLGWMYLNGRGVPRDNSIAVLWFRKAAASGNPQAANLLLVLRNQVTDDKTGCPVHVPEPVVVEVPAPAEIRAMAQRIASHVGLEARLVLAVIAAESAFDSRAVSPKNAKGLMQLIPETAARFGVADPFDPEDNIRGGATYLRWLLRRFDGDVTLALAAYNAGENAVANYGGVPPYAETIDYIERVKKFLGKAVPRR